MTKLTKYEKETIINFNEAEDTASIYTFNTSLKKRLEKFSKVHPDMCYMKLKSDLGAVTYEIKKSRLSIRLLPPYSESRKEKSKNLIKKLNLRTESKKTFI